MLAAVLASEVRSSRGRGYTAQELDVMHRDGFYRDGYSYGRYGIPESGWFEGVAPEHYPEAWRLGWAKGHAEWLETLTCHQCGASIRTQEVAIAHQATRHPWTTQNGGR